MKKKVLIIFITILILLGIGIGVYINGAYPAEPSALAYISQPSEGITVSKYEGNYVFSPQTPTTGIIFYPGGKVEAESYAPFMHQLAENNILSILVSMPANLAVLDSNRADGLLDAFPEIENWYMAGHSLGGSMAAGYLDDNAASFKGLLLLASYSIADLSDRNLQVLSIYGDCDKVINMEAYNENKTNLPRNFTEFIIEGGCHAYFGSYGAQEGDGTPTITREEQLEQTVETIVTFISSDS